MQTTKSYKIVVESTLEKGLLKGPMCKSTLEQYIIGHRMINVINSGLTECSLQEAVENVSYNVRIELIIILGYRLVETLFLNIFYFLFAL
jgi:hypothetical protein